MSFPTFQSLLATYWSSNEVATNVLVFFNLLGALLLGAVVGYERSYHGRAAGMRTYGLVCMASAGLTVVAGLPAFWYGGVHTVVAMPDPTRVMQGIVTGIGFLGAGVIVKEGLSISGLTTAASIWAASCIGVLIGVGFYAAAILLAVLCAATMMWGPAVENWLPAHQALVVTLRFRPHHIPDLPELDVWMMAQGYKVVDGSLLINCVEGRQEWRCVIVVMDRRTASPLDKLAAALPLLEGVEGYALTHTRN